MPDITSVVTFAGNACYGALAIMALWGAYCTILIWRRVGQIRFRNEQEQNEFLSKFDEQLAANDVEAINQMCEEDPRVVPQLAALAVANREPRRRQDPFHTGRSVPTRRAGRTGTPPELGQHHD